MIAPRFTCGERKICLTFKKSQNFMNMVVCKISVCFFMSLLKTLIVKNSYSLAGIDFPFLKKTAWTKLEKLIIPNLDLSEKIGKVAIK